MNYIHTDENAIYYECGYSNDNSIYLVLGKESHLFTDSRYEIEAKEVLKDTRVIICTDLLKEVSNIISQNICKKIKFDPKEWNYYTIKYLQENTKANWIERLQLSHKKRIIKSPKEIKMLSKAVDIGASVFDEFAQMVQKSTSKLDEYRLNIMAANAMRGNKGRELSFSPIVALGANASKPHATPTHRELGYGDILLFDGGLKYHRYCSDRTRTLEFTDSFDFKHSQKFSKKKRQKVYDTVLKAHDKAIKKARSGMKAKQIDAIAREVVEKAGYGKYFVHSTGHGVGLDIHEMPYISSRSKSTIKDGMVYTIEPGIYLPGEFGVRIEDMVVMRDGRADVL